MAGCGVVCGQESPTSPQPPQAATVAYAGGDQKNTTAPCFEPPPIVRLEDYDGPLKKPWNFRAEIGTQVGQTTALQNGGDSVFAGAEG